MKGAGMTGGAQAIESPHPVRASERAASIDVLRGFALLGILGMNIIVFAWPFIVTMDPSFMGPYEGGAKWGFRAMNLLILGKMVFIFSVLFGAGVVFYSRKFESGRLAEGAGLWYRRMALLLMLGVAHAWLLWYGDILVWYAVVGLAALWWLRKLPVWAMITIFAVVLLYFVPVAGAFAMFGQPAFNPDQEWYWNPTAFENELAVYAGEHGTYLAPTFHRMITTTLFYLLFLPFMYGPYLLGAMLLGQALTRLGVLTGRRPLGLYVAMAAIGIPVGLLLAWQGLAGIEATALAGDEPVWWRGALAALSQPIQSLGYVGLVLALWKSGAMGPVATALAAVGRMALTNYLLQTIICTTLFYPHGFGLFGTVPYPHLWGIVAGVWCVNIALSLVWLRYFRFGPAEWLWRCLTYLKLEPIRRRSDPAPVGS